MTAQRHIFVTFAIQDAKYRDLLVTKARKERLNCTFVEMAIKGPGDVLWQNHCRTKISGCERVIVLVSENTAGAAGVLWEVKCAREMGQPILGVSVDFASNISKCPAELEGIGTSPWKWETIVEFLQTGAPHGGAPVVGSIHLEGTERLAG